MQPLEPYTHVLSDPNEVRVQRGRSEGKPNGEVFLLPKNQLGAVVFIYFTKNCYEVDNISIRTREWVACYLLFYHTHQLQIEVSFDIYVDLIGKYSRFLYGMLH